MIWIVYNLLFRIVFTLLLPGYLPRMIRRGGYAPYFFEMLALYRSDTRRRLDEGPSRVWIHAVSVGELYIGLQMLDELRRRDPAMRFLLSVTTSTARSIATRMLQPDTELIYFPADFPSFVRRAMPRLRPRALILVECEVWPNWIRSLHARGIPVFLINARLSDRSFRGYRALRILTRRLFPVFREIFAQSERDRSRFVRLGSDPARTHAYGNAKYDAAARDSIREQQAQAMLRRIGWTADRTVLVGGSTWPGEEVFLLDLFLEWRNTRPDLVLLLAPRHVERTAEIEAILRRREVRWIRRSRIEDRAPTDLPPEVLLLDTTGELRSLYPSGDLVYIGKSLTEHGGQNPIEAAQCGKAVVCGPNMENFRAITADLLAIGGLAQARNENDLSLLLERMLDNPEGRHAMGNQAAAFIAAQSGVLARTADRILQQIPPPSE